MASDILVVDDEADIRELISGILEDEGHSTRLAKDSDETLQTIEEGRAAPGVVVSVQPQSGPPARTPALRRSVGAFRHGPWRAASNDLRPRECLRSVP